MQYKALTRIVNDGIVIEPDTVFDLTPAEAAPLLESGSIEPVRGILEINLSNLVRS